MKSQFLKVTLCLPVVFLCRYRKPVQKVNDLFGFGADFIGGSKWLWQEQHWTHHTYTNHNVKDPDAYGAEPMILFNNYPLGHPKRQWYHSLQAAYFCLVMAGYWLSKCIVQNFVPLNF
jgi:acyl-lipid (7-3)-desaturase (Delta-4 desaturase)